MPLGVETEVGERGVQLSGGQKARLSLARACYSGGSILLLDDPLSAVDAPVARRIFQQCIRGYLKDKAVVLVSHQLAYLAQCDTLLYLEEGR